MLAHPDAFPGPASQARLAGRLGLTAFMALVAVGIATRLGARSGTNRGRGWAGRGGGGPAVPLPATAGAWDWRPWLRPVSSCSATPTRAPSPGLHSSSSPAGACCPGASRSASPTGSARCSSSAPNGYGRSATRVGRPGPPGSPFRSSPRCSFVTSSSLSNGSGPPSSIWPSAPGPRSAPVSPGSFTTSLRTASPWRCCT